MYIWGFKRWRLWACFFPGLGHSSKRWKETLIFAKEVSKESSPSALRCHARTKSPLHGGDLYNYHPALILSYKTKSINLQIILTSCDSDV
jgi:hypothetical protein